MPSAGELGDALRRIAADLPLPSFAEALSHLESAHQRLARVLDWSTQFAAMEIVALLGQLVQAAGEAQQTTARLQTTANSLADKIGSGGEPTDGSKPRTPTRGSAADQRLGRSRTWKTIAEEVGRAVVYPSFRAVRRALGSRPGQEIHHIVEPSQELRHRNGFSRERINTTDNLVWLPVEVHRRISAEYSSIVEGTGMRLRDSLNGDSWGRAVCFWDRCREQSDEGAQDAVNATEELTQARAEFTEHVRQRHAILTSDSPSAARANKHVVATDALVSGWAEQHIVKDVLMPLLDDDNPVIRCSTASYLLYHGESERAAVVLKAIAEDENLGSVGTRAEAALRVWKKRKASG